MGIREKSDPEELEAAARPFVKWAGGKGLLVEEIARRIPTERWLGTRYVEPFVGGGAFFFWLRAHFAQIHCRLADGNRALMETYQSIRDRVDQVLAALEVHASRHSAEYFYAVRRRSPSDAVERAALFIYLNRTCYNGLWRVNRRGEFNVPLGRYESPRIVDEPNLRRVSRALQGVELVGADFESVVEDCGSGDLVYFDPPYHPMSATSRFTGYTAEGFGVEEQRRLACVFEKLRWRGAFVILSNSNTSVVRKLYEGMRPPVSIECVRVPRAINSKGDRRGPVGELLIVGEPNAGRGRH